MANRNNLARQFRRRAPPPAKTLWKRWAPELTRLAQHLLSRKGGHR